jgi:hypothetical protein
LIGTKVLEGVGRRSFGVSSFGVSKVGISRVGISRVGISRVGAASVPLHYDVASLVFVLGSLPQSR